MAGRQSHHTMFEGAVGNIYISQSTVVNGDVAMDKGRKSPFDILRKAVAHTAFHDSGALFDRPKCHPNTRLAVLNKIMDWARRTDEEILDRYVMWLTGAAGAGKSAIAQSFIELCVDNGLVIASFFFNRSDGTRNHAGALIATLAYQIYQAVPGVQDEILAVIEKDPLILKKTLDHQFTQILATPLTRACHSGTLFTPGAWRVILIDGLDECLDPNAQRLILDTISKGIRKYKLPVLFLIASRPEHVINVVFNSQEMDKLFTRIYLDESFHPDDDIQVFLKESFEEIKRKHPFKSLIPTLWPTPEAIRSVVQTSSGQFIYAATVIKFVQSIRHKPHHQLEKVLKLRPLQDGDMPFAQLDALYTMILSSAADISSVLHAIGVYSLGVSKTWNLNLALYMSLDKEDIEILFCDLGALVSVEWNKRKKVTSLKILHASLHDFLLDPARSKDYCINNKAYRTKHMITILRYVIPSLRKPNFNLNEMDWRLESTQDFFKQNCPICEISPELVCQAFSFPLAQIFEDIENFGNRTKHVLSFLCFAFFPLVRRMARLDGQYSLIETRTQDAFDKFLLSNMPLYHDNDCVIAFTCLAYHSGQVEYVPGLINNDDSSTVRIPSDDLFKSHATTGYHTLLLDSIDLSKIGTDEDRYRQCFVSFLQDPVRSGQYTIGADKYTKATSVFMDKISAERCYFDEWTFDESESDLSNQIIFHNNIWTFNSAIVHDIPIFLYLRYIIFFLPKCGKSRPLLEHCQRKEFLTEWIIKTFPTRTARVCQAMRDYLERFSMEYPAADREDCIHAY